MDTYEKKKKEKKKENKQFESRQIPDRTRFLIRDRRIEKSGFSTHLSVKNNTSAYM